MHSHPEKRLNPPKMPDSYWVGESESKTYRAAVRQSVGGNQLDPQTPGHPSGKSMCFPSAGRITSHGFSASLEKEAEA